MKSAESDVMSCVDGTRPCERWSVCYKITTNHQSLDFKFGGPENFGNVCELVRSAQLWQKCIMRDFHNLIEIVHNSSVIKL